MLNVSVLLKDIESPMGKYLICRKDGGKWTLPQGHCRSNESTQKAVERIALQQLGLMVKAGKEQMHAHRKIDFYPTEWTYVDAACQWSSEVKGDTFAETKWVRACELRDYEFEDFDARFMTKFIPWILADGSEIPSTSLK